MNKVKIVVAGAGIYGSTIAIKLAKQGFAVTIFDPLGVLGAASSINQLRIHSGYHYPRSMETITEILASRTDFLNEYKEAIVQDTENYYAIPHEGSLTSSERYEEVYDSFSLNLKKVTPSWINFDFINSCYLVNEEIYDPLILKSIIESRIRELDITLVKKILKDDNSSEFNYVIYATYGASGSHRYLFDDVQVQVAEKLLIELPAELKKKSLVVVDGPFTAFDPYGNTNFFQFGSAKHTNHWRSSDQQVTIPDKYKKYLNNREFIKVHFTHFDKMVKESMQVVPLTRYAKYLGSKFTIRLVEHNPSTDRRILRIQQSDSKTFHVFSGKVVSATKAADKVYKCILDHMNEL